MAEPKTTPNNGSVSDFLDSIQNETRRKDGYALLDIFTRVTGEVPKLWGPSIIGFGRYHYQSERSNQAGDWPLIAFSPRKQNLTLYIISAEASYEPLLPKLGKYTTSKACLYINTLADIESDVLEQVVEAAYRDMQRHYAKTDA
jgi:hypothetical protein